MKSNNVKLVYFDAGRDRIRGVQLSWLRFVLIPLACFVFAVAAVGVVSKLIFSFRENNKIAALESENATLENLLGQFTNKMGNIESQLESMKSRDNHLRTFAEIPHVDEDTWNVGSGGSDLAFDYRLGPIPAEAVDDVIETDLQLDKFQQKVQLLMESLNQIETKLSSDYELRAHTPSVLPVADGIITSKFGHRKDPFVQQVKHHNGIDIVAEHGREVIAPSDGVVELVRTQYEIRQGLGKVVIINHGRGIRTRYGHLNKIFVKQGQKVKRFDRLAEVGNTGRSTGPHLHYEVILNGRFKNPLNYILN